MHVGALVRRAVVTIGPTHTLHDAAARMAEHNVGAAVVLTEDAPGIISERDILRAIARGLDPSTEVVGDHMTWNAVVATPQWDVATAARTMTERGFRHLLVVDEGSEVGIFSIRDLVAALVEDGVLGP
ncbi:MAG TPA: CBS domain-containing protein [Actinomycetota bacterium]|nr:CBS domain-containing protein [Actinomycetota bacterium]